MVLKKNIPRIAIVKKVGGVEFRYYRGEKLILRKRGCKDKDYFEEKADKIMENEETMLLAAEKYKKKCKEMMESFNDVEGKRQAIEEEDDEKCAQYVMETTDRIDKHGSKRGPAPGQTSALELDWQWGKASKPRKVPEKVDVQAKMEEIRKKLNSLLMQNKKQKKSKRK